MNIESKWRNKERKENKKKVEGFGSFQLPSTSARSPHIKDKIEVLQNMFSELNHATNKKKDLKEGFGFDWEGNGYFNHKGGIYFIGGFVEIYWENSRKNDELVERNNTEY